MSLFIISSCKKIEVERINKLVTQEVIWENNSLVVHADLLDIESNKEVVYGFCYAIGETPLVNSAETIRVGVTQSPLKYSANIPNLTSGEDYYVRAFAQTGDYVIYGETKIVNTQISNIQLSGSVVPFNNSKKVEVTGRIINIGNLKVKEVGHCYSLTQNPTINNSKLISNAVNLNGTIDFVSSFTSPIKDTVNYVRCYLVLENNQVYYGSNISYLVKSHKLTTQSLSKINNNKDLLMTAMFNQIGTDSIAEYGFCWSTVTNKPTINNNRQVVLTKPLENQLYTSTYSKTVNSDTSTYYVRAYVISDNEVVYGDVLNIEY